MSTLDLNRLRQTLQQNQRRRDARPTDVTRKILVDRDGRIHLGAKDSDDHRELSEVPQELFASLGGVLRELFGADDVGSPARLEGDRRTVMNKLPSNTREVMIGKVTGFVYDISDELGSTYTMAAYFDGDEYQVKVIYPEVEGKYGVTDAHIFDDGRICLRPPAGGLPTLEEAYAKSVLWASGFTIFQETGEFPWPSH